MLRQQYTVVKRSRLLEIYCTRPLSDFEPGRVNQASVLTAKRGTGPFRIRALTYDSYIWSSKLRVATFERGQP